MIADDACGHEIRAPQRLQGTAFWLLGRASLAAHRRTNQQLTEAGMRRGFYGVLATLVEFGPAAQAEIGRRLGVDPSDMVAILNELAAEGLVSRDRDPTDKRRNSITITEAGHAALGRFDEAIAQAQDAILESFTSAEREQLLDFMQRLAFP